MTLFIKINTDSMCHDLERNKSIPVVPITYKFVSLNSEKETEFVVIHWVGFHVRTIHYYNIIK